VAKIGYARVSTEDQDGTSEPPAGYTTARQAAQMLGVTPRTIERYKAALAGAS